MSAVTEYAGLVHGLDEREYHRLPGLSSTGAKRILRSPAHYRWEQEHRVEKAQYDFGHAVHALVLGTGLDIVKVDADDWRGKAAKDARVEAYATGNVPLLTKDYERAESAAHAVAQHPVAGRLFTGGQAEVSMFWTDADTGVDCRGRLDCISDTWRVVDLKTTRDADPDAFGRIAARYSYDLQAAWYLDGYHAITGDRPDFLHVLVETEPPYGVSVVQLDDEALHVGALKAQQARETYRRCTETGQWPGYPTDIHIVGLPMWALDEYDDTDMVV